MITLTSIRSVVFLAVLVLVGGVLLGVVTFGQVSHLSPFATAIAQATAAAQTGTPVPGAPTGETTATGNGVNVEWVVIATLIGLIFGVMVGRSLMWPVISP
ncbi:MAG: hypothetical protein AAB486_03500 [Patescibacteria group bacterium]